MAVPHHLKKERTHSRTLKANQLAQTSNILTTENNILPLFTEHELDEDCGGGTDNLGSKCDGIMRNCSTKSHVLAPFNSTWSDKRMQEQGVE